MNNIKIEVELRPCLANGKKALFHTWIKEKTRALVEYEDGTLSQVHYSNIKLISNNIREYCYEY